MEKTTLIVGLGNPGEKFNNTPHNVGFEAVNRFKEKNNFPDFIFQKKLQAEISEENIFGKDVVLAKPQTFMNNSGKAVKKITKNYKAQTINLIVIHDDIDLPLGTIKISRNRGSAGHKGVESIIKSLGTEDFIRIRIGIQPTIGKSKQAEKYVLKKFGKEQREILETIFDETSSTLQILIEHGLEKAMNECNK